MVALMANLEISRRILITLSLGVMVTEEFVKCTFYVGTILLKVSCQLSNTYDWSIISSPPDNQADSSNVPSQQHLPYS
jgi:hypothetical protein